MMSDSSSSFIIDSKQQTLIKKGPHKVALVGESCGKSAIVCRFRNDEYKEESDATVEDSYVVNNFAVDGDECRLEILDTSGNDCYSDRYLDWFSMSEGFALVYSVTSTNSFDAIPKYIDEIQKCKKSKGFPMVLVATQADVPDPVRAVTEKEGRSVAYRYKCPFVEVSAKSGANIKTIFESLVKEVRKYKVEQLEVEKQEKQSKSKGEKEVKAPILSIMEKSAVMFKQTGTMVKGWKTVWVGISNGALIVWENQKELLENKPSITTPLLTTTVKPFTSKEKPNSFELVSIQRSFVLATETKDEMTDWMKKIQDTIAACLNGVTSVKEMKSLAADRSPEQEWRLIQKVSTQNCVCADCNAQEPDWASINLGILICIQCSGVHRSLGTHISKVRSLTLDKLDEEVYEFMKRVGNTKANTIWEAEIPPGITKPSPRDDRTKKEKWIRAKYDKKDFISKKSPEDKTTLPMCFYLSISKTEVELSYNLLAQGAPIDWINPEENNMTPLHMASMQGSLISSVFLVLNNAKLDILDSESRSALDCAQIAKQRSIEDWLSKKGAIRSVTKEIQQVEEPAAASSAPTDNGENKPAAANENQPPTEPIVVPKPTFTPQKLADLVKTRSAENIVAMIFANDAQLDVKEVGEFLGGSLTANSNLLNATVNYLNFTNMEVVYALRSFVSSFTLPHDPAKCVKILESFSRRYFSLNYEGSVFTDADSIYLLSWCILFLNINIHITTDVQLTNLSVKSKISKQEFVNYYHESVKINREILENIYKQVTSEKENTFGDMGGLISFLSQTERAGWLTKQGGKRKTWKKRWFILKEASLFYYKSSTDKEPIGILYIDPRLMVAEDSQKKNCFAISSCAVNQPLRAVKIKGLNSKKGNHDTFCCSADTANDATEWIKELRKAIDRSFFYDQFRNKRNSLKKA